MPASCASSSINVGENGTCSLGLRMNALPVAIAYGQNQQGTIAGKLNGVTAANTPSGWRTYSQSMPAATSSSVLPIMSVGIPQACSTFSMPRRTEPRASSSVFPFSRVTVAAISSKCCSIRYFSLKR